MPVGVPLAGALDQTRLEAILRKLLMAPPQVPVLDLVEEIAGDTADERGEVMAPLTSERPGGGGCGRGGRSWRRSRECPVGRTSPALFRQAATRPGGVQLAPGLG